MIFRTEWSIPCNLCGSIIVEELCLKNRKGHYLRTVICKKCGLIWSDPRPSETKIKEFYSKEYRKEYKGIHKPKLKHIYRDAKEAIRRYNFIKEILSKEAHILDIGAGTGVFVYTLCKLGFKASGTGPGEGHTKFAREELHVPVTLGFLQDINGKEPYDIITLHHTLEHLVDPFAELSNIWKLLKKNGYLVIEVPNSEDTKQDPKNRYHKAHIYTFNPETLAEMGKKAGFEVYKKEIALFNGNITMIFAKSIQPSGISGELPGNFSKITTILNHHTTFRYFTSLMPYKKFIANVIKAIEEQIAIRNFTNEIDIINSVIPREIHQ